MERGLFSSKAATKLSLAVAILGIGLVGCQKDLYDPSVGGEGGEDTTIKEFFNYEGVRDILTTVSYNVPAGYQVRFEIYDANPMATTADGQVAKRSDLKPLAVGTTDGKGVYNGTFSLPASMTTAYVYSSDAGVPLLLETTVSAGAMQATSAQAISPVAQTRGNVAFKNVTSPGTFLTLKAGAVTWSPDGATTNSDQAETTDFSKKLATIYTAVNDVLAEDQDPKGLQMGTGDYTTDLIAKEGKVYLRYISGKSSSVGTLAYYCYPEVTALTDQSISALHKCIVFANTSSDSYYGNGVLKDGTCVELKYIAPDGSFKEGFPVGTRIGFVLYNNGYRAGKGDDASFNVASPFYSTPVKNGQLKTSFTATFTYRHATDEDITVVGFEDWDAKGDFNDLVFNVTGVEPTNVLDEKTVEYPGATAKGVLAFEDNWPNEGDYDLNDVVVKYSATPTYAKITNLTTSAVTYSKVKLVKEFFLSWTGAAYKNGFGYEVQLGEDVESISLTRNGEVVPNPIVEKGTDGKYVIMLFNDARKELGVEGVAPPDMPSQTIAPVHYTVTVTFNKTTLVAPPVFDKAPYNPFVTIGGNRSREVHLIDHKPTSKADTSLFGTGADTSNGSTTFYRNKSYWPFAINLDASGSTNASAWEIDLKNENVRIDASYPKFIDWANSQGGSNVIWWK